jgi:ribosomal-protein-alanine N-acetyltransferase
MTKAGARGDEAASIRDFRKSDLDDLLNLLPKCFSKEFEVTGFDPVHLKDAVGSMFGMKRRFFLAMLRLVGKEPVKFLVTEAKNRVVGTTMVNCGKKVGYISWVMVHPDYRRKGIATALMKSAIEYIRKKGMDRAVLNVVSTNTPATDMYLKLGFKEFRQDIHLVGETESIRALGGANGVETRHYQKADMDAVYNLVMASEDPNSLRILGFNRSILRTPIWSRLIRSSTEKRIVAVCAGKIVGSVLAEYTTPKVPGIIMSIQVKPEDRGHQIEGALIGAAINEIRSGAGKIRAMAPATRRELIEAFVNSGFRETMVMVGMSKELRP